MARLVAPEELTLLVRASGSLMTTLGTDATRQRLILVPHITSYSINRELKHQTFSTERRQPEVKSLPIHVSGRQGQPSRLYADFV